MARELDFISGDSFMEKPEKEPETLKLEWLNKIIDDSERSSNGVVDLHKKHKSIYEHENHKGKYVGHIWITDENSNSLRFIDIDFLNKTRLQSGMSGMAAFLAIFAALSTVFIMLGFGGFAVSVAFLMAMAGGITLHNTKLASNVFQDRQCDTPTKINPSLKGIEDKIIFHRKSKSTPIGLYQLKLIAHILNLLLESDNNQAYNDTLNFLRDNSNNWEVINDTFSGITFEMVEGSFTSKEIASKIPSLSLSMFTNNNQVGGSSLKELETVKTSNSNRNNPHGLIDKSITESVTAINRHEEVIDSLIILDDRLSIMRLIEKMPLEHAEAWDYERCYKALVECAEMLNSSESYAYPQVREDELKKFHRIVDVVEPVFENIVEQVDRARSRKLDEALIYVTKSFSKEDSDNNDDDLTGSHLVLSGVNLDNELNALNNQSGKSLEDEQVSSDSKYWSTYSNSDLSKFAIDDDTNASISVRRGRINIHEEDDYVEVSMTTPTHPNRVVIDCNSDYLREATSGLNGTISYVVPWKAILAMDSGLPDDQLPLHVNITSAKSFPMYRKIIEHYTGVILEGYKSEFETMSGGLPKYPDHLRANIRKALDDSINIPNNKSASFSLEWNSKKDSVDLFMSLSGIERTKLAPINIKYEKDLDKLNNNANGRQLLITIGDIRSILVGNDLELEEVRDSFKSIVIYGGNNDYYNDVFLKLLFRAIQLSGDRILEKFVEDDDSNLKRKGADSESNIVKSFHQKLGFTRSTLNDDLVGKFILRSHASSDYHSFTLSFDNSETIILEQEFFDDAVIDDIYENVSLKWSQVRELLYSDANNPSSILDSILPNDDIRDSFIKHLKGNKDDIFKAFIRKSTELDELENAKN